MAPIYKGSLAFDIKDKSICVDEWMPSLFDYRLYVEVDESVYKTAMKMYQDTVAEIQSFITGPESPIRRELQVLDCLYYKGLFLLIKQIKNDCINIDCISVSQYDLNIFSSENLLEELELSDMKFRDDCVFITKEVYDSAYKVTNEAIKNITAYLKNEFINA